MSFETISAPWQAVFERLVGSIQDYGLFVSPYIAAGPVQRVAQILQNCGIAPNVRLDVMVNLTVENILRGFTDPSALLLLMDAIPQTRVTHLPRLHAKVYIADESEAIITSGNLTESGLSLNYEYGVRITDTAWVRHIREDILTYGQLGNIVPRPKIEQLAQTANSLKDLSRQMEQKARRALREEFQRRTREAETELMEIRAHGKTTNSIFANTIVYLLRKYGPMGTTELHPLIQQIHPDLCDDSIDRVIQGVHFGKKWKHYVRNAQQYLKRHGVIGFDGIRWYLTD